MEKDDIQQREKRSGILARIRLGESRHGGLKKITQVITRKEFLNGE